MRLVGTGELEHVKTEHNSVSGNYRGSFNQAGRPSLVLSLCCALLHFLQFFSRI